ncbi:MAG: hypothetical protein AAF570_09800, partial [Bacteroidota bacterium]
MKTQFFFRALLLLLPFFPAFSNLTFAQGWEIPYRLTFKNLTQPTVQSAEKISKNDEIQVTWKLNKNSKFAQNHPEIYKIEVEYIDLLAQLKLGAPHKILKLHPTNNPGEVSVRLKIADVEPLLRYFSDGEFGTTFKSETKFYLRFGNLTVHTGPGESKVL